MFTGCGCVYTWSLYILLITYFTAAVANSLRQGQGNAVLLAAKLGNVSIPFFIGVMRFFK